MGPSLGFVSNVYFFSGRPLLHIMVCSIASFDLYYAIVVLHHWRLFFSIRFEFQVIKKDCEGSGDGS